MKNTHKQSKKSSAEIWDHRELGASEQHVRKSSPEREKKLDEQSGLQTISIRLQKSLIDSLKKLAEEDGIRYQPYVRQLLMRHVRQLNQEKKAKARQAKHLFDTR